MGPTEEPQHGEEHVSRQGQRPEEGGVRPPLVHVWFQASPGQDAQVPLFCVQSGGGAVPRVGGAQEGSTVTF